MRTRNITMACMVAAVLGCGINPDGQSGGDERRDLAKELQLDEWVTDDNGVSHKKGDRTDWKFVIAPHDGRLFVTVAVTEKDATVSATLYDRYGRMLIEKTKKRGFTDHVTFEGEVTKGKYFLRVQATDTEDASAYDIRASMEGGTGVGDIPPPE